MPYGKKDKLNIELTLAQIDIIIPESSVLFINAGSFKKSVLS